MGLAGGCATMHHDSLSTRLPAEFAAAEATLRAALDVTAHADEWDSATRAAVLEWSQQRKGVLAAIEGRVLVAESNAGTYGQSGDRDLAAWAGRTTRQGRGAGFASIAQAATLEAMPAVADALVAGPVTPAHLAQLTRASAGSRAYGEHLATHQAEVVRLAGRMDATQFGKHLAHEAARLDPASRQRTHDEQRANRFLFLSHGAGGTTIKGQLDSVAGNLVQRAIDALNPLPTADDDRDRGQRQADAFERMARSVLSDRATTPGSVVMPQVTLMVSEETWTALRRPTTTGAGAATAEARRGSTRDVVARLTAVVPVSDEDGNVLPASEIARALCDCEITRMVMDSAGVPIDEGRRERLFTAHQRKAVIARDGGGCTIGACTMPARYTQLHHITWWSRGGPTDLDQAIQLCDGHHGYVHDHDVAIQRNRDGTYAFVLPDGRLMPGSPPPDSPPAAEPCPPEGPVAIAPAAASVGDKRVQRTAGSAAGPPNEQMLWSA